MYPGTGIQNIFLKEEGKGKKSSTNSGTCGYVVYPYFLPAAVERFFPPTCDQ
jgi:hypothetical protein